MSKEAPSADRLAWALMALGLAGCSAGVSRDGDATIVESPSSIAWVHEFTLKDGTRCAALIGSSKGALSCDWRHDGK